MLADRKARGDNEATAASLAAVLQRVASGDIPGVRREVIDAIRGAVLVEDLPGGRHHYKTGEIDSDPLTRVRTGWIETPWGEVVVYAVMTRQLTPGTRPRRGGRAARGDRPAPRRRDPQGRRGERGPLTGSPGDSAHRRGSGERSGLAPRW